MSESATEPATPATVEPTPLTVAISSRALFDLAESNEIYDSAGLEAYRQYQILHEDDPLAPGEALNFVRKLCLTISY